MFPYPRQQPQPHCPTCHTQREKELHSPPTVNAVVHAVLETEPCILAGELRGRGDAREDGEDEFVWEFEKCRNEMQRDCGLVQRSDTRARTRQVWGRGGPRDSESERCFTPKLSASLENNVEGFPG